MYVGVLKGKVVRMLLNLRYHQLNHTHTYNCCCLAVHDSCDPIDYSMPISSVLFYLSEFAQIWILWVRDAIQSFHPLLPPSPFAFKDPASGSFPMSWLFISGGQSIGASESATVLSMNIQGWLPLGLTDLISLLSKRLSRFFSSTIQKHQFFSTQTSLWSNSHIHTWLLEKP